MRRPPAILVAFAVIAAVTASCGGKDGTGPSRPGSPTAIKVSAGDAQTGAAGGVLAAPLAAKVTDGNGRGVPNIAVTFQAMPGSGSVTPTAARTNGAGIATTSWSLPTAAGTTARVRAVFVDTLTGALVDSVSFTARVVGGEPVYIQRVNAPPVAATGSSVGLSVIFYDQYQNRSPNVPVSWTVTAGSGTLSAATTRSDSNGVASVSLTLGGTAGTNSVRVSYSNLGTTYNIEGRTPGVPVSIAAGSYPGVAPASGTVALQATVRDGLGAGVSGATVNWTVTGGGGAVSAPSTTTGADGVATVQFTLGAAAGPNSVQAAIGGLTATFSIQGQILTQRLAYLSSNGYGIARTGGGRFVVALIYAGAVETFQQNTPTVKQTIRTGGTPVNVAVDAAGTYAYVSNLDGWLSIIDLGTNAVVSQVTIPGAHSVAISPAGDRVFVASTQGQVYAVSVSSRTIVGSVPVPNGPWGFAFRATATDSLMYVTARDGGTVTEIDIKTLTVVRTFNIGGRPHGLAISPDGSTLYAADLGLGQIKAIDVATGSVTRSAALPGAFGLVISPDGSTLFATTDNAGVVLDARSVAVTRIVDTGGNPRQLVVAPDGASAYAGNTSGWVDIIPR